MRVKYLQWHTFYRTPDPQQNNVPMLFCDKKLVSALDL